MELRKQAHNLLFFSEPLKNTDYESNYNVRDVWKMNYTGAGVVVTVVDDGLDPTHFELSRNYVSPLLLILQGLTEN